MREKLRRMAADYSKADIWLYAASGTYYFFFSLGPLAAILLGLLPYLPFGEGELLGALLDWAPEPFRRLVTPLLEDVYAGSAAALGIGAVVELWSAGKFLGLLMGGVGRIYDGQAPGGYLHRRLMGAVCTAAVIVLILANLVLLLFGERLLGRSWLLVGRLRGAVFFAAVTAVNVLLFRYVPRQALTFRRQLPGAALAAGLWLAFSQVYSWAVERFRFFSVYGGLAIVVISMFWMYCSLYILFFGAWLNAWRQGQG